MSDTLVKLVSHQLGFADMLPLSCPPPLLVKTFLPYPFVIGLAAVDNAQPTSGDVVSAI
jgi:hypothetical protein